jgi:hypothetical protein
MTRPSSVTLVTLGLLTAALVGTVVQARISQDSSWSLSTVLSSLKPKLPTPEDGVYAMLDAAREGNIRAYLDCYSGSLLDRLKQSLAESGEDEFTKYLHAANARIQGVAMTAPEQVTADEVKLRIDYVYTDRTEAQTVYLRKDSRRWRIYRIDAVQLRKTLIPFGATVSD